MLSRLMVPPMPPKHRTDDCVHGLRGYAKVDFRGHLHTYFMVTSPEGTQSHTFSMNKYGYAYSYMLASEAYSKLHSLSALEEMDILGKLPCKDELRDHMYASLQSRGYDISKEQLIGEMG